MSVVNPLLLAPNSNVARRMDTECPKQLGGANVVAYAEVKEKNSHAKNTKQIVAGEIKGSATAMVIAQYDGETNFYLFGVYGNEWASETDTWHQAIEDAVDQMDWEYTNLSENLVWVKEYEHLKAEWEANKTG